MNRKIQQAELISQFGMLIGPLTKLVESPEDYDAELRARVIAAFQMDCDAFFRLVTRYCTGERGHHYFKEQNQIFGVINDFRDIFGYLAPQQFSSLVKAAPARIYEIIHSIPVPVDSKIYEAQTPFSTYRFVKDLCNTAAANIIWTDRYFDHSIFHRYFSDVPPAVLITLVTLPASVAKRGRDEQRVKEFMDVSRMFAHERGTSGYRLVENDRSHDRLLLCDNEPFALGGSIKDLYNSFTISRLDPTEENRATINGLVHDGTEVFGPVQLVHP